MGRDSRGCVRGMGMGVSRTNLCISSPLMDNLASSQAAHSSLTFKVEEMSAELHTIKDTLSELHTIKDTLSKLTERIGISTATNTDNGGSSQVQCKTQSFCLHKVKIKSYVFLTSFFVFHNSHAQATHSMPPPVHLGQRAACRLMHMLQESTCVAEGRVLGDSSGAGAVFTVIIDEVLVHDCFLIDRPGTFADIEIGETIKWPQFKTVLL